MNYSITIIMTYVGLGGNSNGSVTKVCNADVSNIKLSSKNIAGGRRSDNISGNVIVTNEYDDFAIYINDKSGYYVDNENYTYTLYMNGNLLNTNKIKLVGNDIDNSVLTFKLYGDVINEYTNIYNNYETEHNILDGVTGVGNTVDYIDFRTRETSTDTGGVVITSFDDLVNYVTTVIDAYDTYAVYKIEFTEDTPYVWVTTIHLERFWAYGYDNDGINEPPSGIDWVYDSMVGVKPKFVKKPKHISTTYSTNISPPTMDDTTMTTEQIADVSYSSIARNLQTTLTYLIDLADSTIVIDGSSYNGLDLLTGTTDGTFTNNKFLASAKIMAVSDFLPTLAGNQKTNAASKGMLSLSAILTFLESLGFYWYLEESGGDYYFRINHIKLKSLGSSNPDLTDYYNRDRTAKTRNIQIQEDEFNKISNNNQGKYEFSQPEFVYKTGTKSKVFGDNRIFTDIDHVLDGKESVIDITSGEQWVIFACYSDDIRYFTSDLSDIDVNNYELSFYYLTENILKMPGKYKDIDIDSTRLQKKQTIQLNLPFDNPQSDFDFYDSVTYFSETAEIDSIEMGILDSIGQMTIKYI